MPCLPQLCSALPPLCKSFADGETWVCSMCRVSHSLSA